MMSAEKVPIRRMGGIAFDTTVLALGCWAFGGSSWGSQEDADSRAALEAALAAGITHFDTAQGYGSGRSERLVGEVLGGREDVFVATKFNIKEATVAGVRAAVRESRDRLRLERIPLFYLHWPRPGVEMGPVFEGLAQVYAEGEIGAIGVSNFSVEQLQQASALMPIHAHQFCYNLFWRFPERDVIPYCREHGIGTVTYSSIAQGLLTGKFGPRPTFPEGDLRSKTVYFEPEVYPHCYAGVEKLKALAAECGRELVHLAIRWVAAQPGIDSVLVGARRADQVRHNAAAFAGEIAPEVFARMTAIADEVMAHVPDAGNLWRHQP